MGMLKRGLALIFKRKDFGLLMAVQFAAQAGDGIVQTALAKYIVFGGQKGFDVEAAGSPEELLRIVLFVFVPYTFVSPFLGVAIDRWDRRRLLFVANALRAGVVVLVALFGVAAASGGEDLPGLLSTSLIPQFLLFAVFLLTLASTRVVLATKSAALPATLGETSLLEGNAVSQLGGALFQLAAGGAAFVATLVLPAEPVVLAGAVVYAIGAIPALSIARPDEGRERSTFAREVARVFGNIVAGIKEVAETPKAGAAITTYFWLRFLWSASLFGIGLIARELVVGDDLQLVALTGGGGAVGAALGFLLADKLQARARTTGYLVLAAGALAGLAVAILGSLELKVAIVILTFFLGLGFFLGKITLDTMVQEALGDDFRGRAFSLYDIAYNVAWLLAAVIFNIFWTREVQGPLIVAIGVVFLVGLLGIALWFRRAGLLAMPPAVRPSEG